jgi:hypothetical protein
VIDLGRFRVSNVREAWDRIKPGVERALHFQQEGLRPEDAYAELKSGAMDLLECDDGFVIVQRQEEQLLIWLGYSHATRSVITEYTGELTSIAKQMGCKSMTFVTTRRGYERRAVAAGWSIQHVRYTKEV